MAYFHYLSEVENDCLTGSFKSLLEEAGLQVLNEFSNHSQVFAEKDLRLGKPDSKVKVLISWKDKALRQCSIEIRSDEPHLKKDTSCKRVAHQIRNLIPPKFIPAN